MNWYKEAKHDSKTRRHDKGSIPLWHVSPDRLSRLSPRSSFRGQPGLYLSPSYKSAIRDWAPYVKGKKNKSHQLDIQFRALLDEFYDIDSNKEMSPEEEQHFQELEAKIAKLRESRDSDEHQRNQTQGYKTLYVHKISCPRDVYKKSLAAFMAVGEESDFADMGFWAWGEQVFILEQYLPSLKVIKIETLSEKEYYEKWNDSSPQRYRHQ